MYQAATRPTPAEEPLRVVLVIEVPANAADLAVRTAELADEYARVIAMSIPGVRPYQAVVEGRRAPTVPSREGLLIDHVRRHVLVDGVPVRLAYREFELLRYLAGRPGSVVSRDELVREVWHDAPPAAHRRLGADGGHSRSPASRQTRSLPRGSDECAGSRVSLRAAPGRARRRACDASGVTIYSVAVSGPDVWQMDFGGLPVDAHPRPVAV
jgi:hypothetical protein